MASAAGQSVSRAHRKPFRPVARRPVLASSGAVRMDGLVAFPAFRRGVDCCVLRRESRGVGAGWLVVVVFSCVFVPLPSELIAS